VVLFGAGNVAAALSQNGSLVYVRGNPLSQLALLDAQGHEVGHLDDWRLYDYLRISPDGRRIAVSVGRSVGGADIWVYDLSSQVLSRLTTSERAVRPEWTPDGRRIAYLNTQQVQWDVWWAPADGSGPAKRLYGVPGARISEVSFAPSGDALLRVDDPRTGRDILLLPLKGDSAARATVPLVASPANELQPRVSPDGHWLAYVSDESGAVEVYLRPFPGPGGRVQVSSGGGTEPVWSVDGKRLFYRDGSRFVAASLTTSPGIAVAGRQELFEDRYKTGLFRARYDVHPDGKRFVVLRPPAESEQIIVTLNWLADLRARLSAREPAKSP
jgi:dipeptidyl aminopeptidase/acylaminoacyl peptidase